MQRALRREAVEAQHCDAAVEKDNFRRCHHRGQVGKKPRGRHILGNGNREQAKPRFWWNTYELTSLANDSLVALAAQKQIMKERVDRVTRGFVFRVFALGNAFDSREEKVERVVEIVAGGKLVAHHDDDEAEARLGFERPHDRDVFADGERIVDDEAVLFRPWLEALVQLEFPDVLLGMVAVPDQLHRNRIVTGSPLGVGQKLESRIHYDDVVAQHLLAHIHKLLKPAAAAEHRVHIALPHPESIEDFEQRVEYLERSLSPRDGKHGGLVGLGRVMVHESCVAAVASDAFAVFARRANVEDIVPRNRRFPQIKTGIFEIKTPVRRD